MIAECEADEQQGRIAGIEGRTKTGPRGPKVRTYSIDMCLYQKLYSLLLFLYRKFSLLDRKRTKSSIL